MIMQSSLAVHITLCEVFSSQMYKKKITRSTVRNFNYIKSNAVKVLPNALAYQKKVYKYFLNISKCTVTYSVAQV